MTSANSPEPALLPHPDKLRHLAICLSALDIIFCERTPVFTFEKNWHTDVSTLLVDTRDGGQMSIRFSGKAALIKGTRSDAFMHPGGTPPFKPETRLGFVTYPGLLEGFPAPLENLLLSNDSFSFLTFCRWHLHDSGSWETGRIVWPEEVDDPDGSADLFEHFQDSRNVFVRSSAELYGATVTDLDALDEIFKQKPITESLLKRLGAKKSLQSYQRRLQEIEYGVDPYEEPSIGKQVAPDAGQSAGAEPSGTAQSEPKSSFSKREQELKQSTAFATPQAIGVAIGDFFKGTTNYIKEHGAAGIAQDALATAMGAVTDVINQVPHNSPIRKEPLFKWQVLTNAKLLLARKVGMAGMLETIIAEFTSQYADGRKRALVRFADSLEHDFRTMPHFLDESLLQLQGVYQRAGDEFKEDADIFKSRLERSKNRDTQSIKILTDLPCVRITCTEASEKERILNRIKRLIKDCGNNTYHLSADAGEVDGVPTALVIVLVSRETDSIFEIIRSNLKDLELPPGSVLISPKGERTPVVDG